jgi:multiple sugar transport system ATP-binding protein
MASLRLEQIYRQFERSAGLVDISFSVPDGEFWVLVGPSGCGKSTLLRLIAGLDFPTQGQLFLDDCPMTQLPARARDVAMVFQNYALYPHMSVADNLAFGLKMRGVETGQIGDRIQQVARMLDIVPLLDRKPKQLSGGQQQRVALGRAIARQPQLFLLDEPLSNLDAQLRDETRAELKRLHQQVGITTLYVTHDQTEAMTLADRIVVLDHGQIQQLGTPNEIYQRPANRMVAKFLGNPAMNLLPVVFDGSDLLLAGQRLTCPGALRPQLAAGQRIELGIRPEHCHLAQNADAAQVNIRITLLEPLGRETLVRSEVLGDVPPSASPLPHHPPGSAPILLFSVPASTNVKVGDRLSIALDQNHISLFEPSSGEALYHSAPA